MHCPAILLLPFTWVLTFSSRNFVFFSFLPRFFRPEVLFSSQYPQRLMKIDISFEMLAINSFLFYHKLYCFKSCISNLATGYLLLIQVKIHSFQFSLATTLLTYQLKKCINFLIKENNRYIWYPFTTLPNFNIRISASGHFDFIGMSL